MVNLDQFPLCPSQFTDVHTLSVFVFPSVKTLQEGKPNSIHGTLCLAHTKLCWKAEAGILSFQVLSHKQTPNLLFCVENCHLCCCYLFYPQNNPVSICCEYTCAKCKESNFWQKEEIGGTTIASGNPNHLHWILARLIYVSAIQKKSQGEGCEDDIPHLPGEVMQAEGVLVVNICHGKGRLPLQL